MPPRQAWHDSHPHRPSAVQVAFRNGYMPCVQRRCKYPFSSADRDWQLQRLGDVALGDIVEASRSSVRHHIHAVVAVPLTVAARGGDREQFATRSVFAQQQAHQDVLALPPSPKCGSLPTSLVSDVLGLSCSPLWSWPDVECGTATGPDRAPGINCERSATASCVGWNNALRVACSWSGAAHY